MYILYIYIYIYIYSRQLKDIQNNTYLCYRFRNELLATFVQVKLQILEISNNFPTRHYFSVSCINWNFMVLKLISWSETQNGHFEPMCRKASLTHRLTHWLAHSLTRSLTDSLARSLTQPTNQPTKPTNRPSIHPSIHPSIPTSNQSANQPTNQAFTTLKILSPFQPSIRCIAYAN